MMRSLQERMKQEKNEQLCNLLDLVSSLKNQLAKKDKEKEDLMLDFEKRLQLCQDEYEQSMDEGYQEAYKMILEEKKRSDEERELLEVRLYDEYDKKLAEIRKYIVEKVDQFIEVEWGKMVEVGAEELAAKFDAFRKAFTPAEIVQLALGEEVKEGNLQKENKKLKAKVMRQEVERMKLVEIIGEESQLIAELRLKYEPEENEVTID